MDIKRTPVKAPLPCYALEYDSLLEKCQACPHQSGCRDKVGERVGMVEIGKLEYALIPKAFSGRKMRNEDPDFVQMQEVYVQCHNAVFDEDTRDLVSPHRHAIAERAEEANLSIRTFMLSCMFGHKSTSENAIGHSASGRFSPKTLTYPSAPATARTYVNLCREKFGAFSLSALTALTGEDFEKNDFYRQMVSSEVIAGTYIIGWKLKNDGLPYEQLYKAKEIDLSPHWLATCPHYESLVLTAYLKEPFGSRMERRHRSAVLNVIRSMSRNKNTAKAVFYARQQAAPEAVKNTLTHFGYRMNDIEAPNEPVTDMLELWLSLARCIQQVEALKYVCGMPSVIDRIFAEAMTKF